MPENITPIIDEILTLPHVLIGGQSGSGKSVLLRNIVNSIIEKSPDSAKLVLIDPKRIDMLEYKNAPHTLFYATELDEMNSAVDFCVNEMEKRYKDMQEGETRDCTECDIYLIVDEYADIITEHKKLFEARLARLARLARASNIHMILATQRPTREVVCGLISSNISARVALRCADAQEARNMKAPDANKLPRFGKAYLVSPERSYPVLFDVPYIDFERTKAIVDKARADYTAQTTHNAVNSISAPTTQNHGVVNSLPQYASCNENFVPSAPNHKFGLLSVLKGKIRSALDTVHLIVSVFILCALSALCAGLVLLTIAYLAFWMPLYAIVSAILSILNLVMICDMYKGVFNKSIFTKN